MEHYRVVRFILMGSIWWSAVIRACIFCGWWCSQGIKDILTLPSNAELKKCGCSEGVPTGSLLVFGRDCHRKRSMIMCARDPIKALCDQFAVRSLLEDSAESSVS